ncbi:hypothetical protein E1176_05775 [Fulvivirga sp. RKSG066]|uniref:carboxylesterase family protein n=1 Tax=Fulvivirga aurantia TaxID=2529383 RepID=UPI0012BD3E84|nr:hypothetical protein [Fulvivirga aurantia]MTI20522.1 hypothetical protein [Fulvivirga aurantia]
MPQYYIYFLLLSLTGLTCCSEEKESDCIEVTWYEDNDRDGKGNPESSLRTCEEMVEGYVLNDEDTNDNQPDCPNPITYYKDRDGDGLGDPTTTKQACSQPKGYVTNDEDIGLPEGPSSKRLAKYKKGEYNDTYAFWEYLPEGYNGETKYPLMIYLHGAGERDKDDNEANVLDNILRHGPPKHISSDEWPVSEEAGDSFIVLSPQHVSAALECHEADPLRQFLLWALEEYRVDSSRIYFTGNSCGGVGISNYLTYYLNEEPQIAAVVPIAGELDLALDANGCALGQVPIWAFHGDSDETVPVEGTTVPISYLQNNCTNTKEIKMTIYEGVGHFSWGRTYDGSEGHDVFSWLLSKQLEN